MTGSEECMFVEDQVSERPVKFGLQHSVFYKFSIFVKNDSI